MTVAQKSPKMVQKVLMWSDMTQNGKNSLKWPKKVWTDVKEAKMAQNVLKWSQMDKTAW
jgi:hypothetical protein